MRLTGITSGAVLFGALGCFALPLSAAPSDGDAGKPLPKEVFAKCRAEADAKGLVQPQKRAYVRGCFMQARPDLAVVMRCRKEGHDKGLKDEELRTYVQTCKQKQS